MNDLVIGIVTCISDDGLVLRLLCMDDKKNRDVDTLKITVSSTKVFPSTEASQLTIVLAIFVDRGALTFSVQYL